MRTQNRFAELDALRGIAALMVVFFHYTIHRSEAALGFKFGITGVDLFFVISGFVITMSISRVKSGLDFVINRASRLYPAYWTAATITFLLLAVKSFGTKGSLVDASFVSYFANLTMFQYYFGVLDLDGSYWSLIVEMVFYFCILLLLQFRQLKNINTIAIAVIGSTVITQGLFWNDSVKLFLDYAILLKYLPLFVAGINFYTLATDKENKVKPFLMVLFCFISQLLLFKNCSRTQEYLSFVEYTVALTIIFSLFILFVGGKLRFIVSKPTLFLGKISYPLYLTHQFLALQILFPVLLKNLHLNFWVTSFGIALPINIVLAVIITRFVDEPMSKKMKTFLRTLADRKIVFHFIPIPRWKTKTAGENL